MFIGHLPAGYLLTRAMRPILHSHAHTKLAWKPFLCAGLVGSLLPDIDMFYFYLIDHGQHLHHGYLTHMPVFWAVAGLLVLLCIVASNRKKYFPYAAVGWSSVFLHLVLDTIVGKVRWLYPISNQDFFFFNVPAGHGWYVWNFFLHWTFLFEIFACIAAVYVYVQCPLVAEGDDN